MPSGQFVVPLSTAYEFEVPIALALGFGLRLATPQGAPGVQVYRDREALTILTDRASRLSSVSAGIVTELSSVPSTSATRNLGLQKARAGRITRIWSSASTQRWTRPTWSSPSIVQALLSVSSGLGGHRGIHRGTERRSTVEAFMPFKALLAFEVLELHE